MARAHRARRWWRAVLGHGPVGRLLIVHTVAAAADAAFTVSLAGSLFLSVSVDAARPRILLYLALTLAPFAIVGPFVGGFTDRIRGGHRAVLALTTAGRAVTSLLIANQLTTLFFFPEAFAMLVLGRTYSIAKSALVPRLVEDPRQLVAVNAHLARMSLLGGLVGGVAGAGVLRYASAPAVDVVAAGGFLAALALSWRVPRPSAVVAANPVVETAELTSSRLGLSATAMSLIRFSVGFATFLLALNLKTSSESAWVYGLVLVAGGVAAFGGTLLAPRLRRRFSEETLLGGALAALAIVCVVAATQHRRTGAIVVAAMVGLSETVGRQAFDSTTQRLAPDAEKGRAFARFETRFQLAWVAGAIGPVLLRPPPYAGLLVLGAVLALGWLFYIGGHRALKPTAAPSDSNPVASLVELAHALRAQGARGLAVLTAIEAVRVSVAVDPACDGEARLLGDLSALWQRVAEGGAVSDEDVEVALAAAASARDGLPATETRAPTTRPSPTMSSPTSEPST